MKENKLKSNFIFNNNGNVNTRNKSIKLTEIKNLYSINKSLNFPNKIPSLYDNVSKIRPLETEINTFIKSNKPTIYSVNKDKNLITNNQKSIGIPSKILPKNCFTNYISNSRKIRNSSAISNVNKTYNNYSQSSLDNSFNLLFKPVIKDLGHENYLKTSKKANSTKFTKVMSHHVKSKSFSMAKSNNSVIIEKDKLTSSTRKKLQYLKNIMQDLTKNNNITIITEMNNLYWQILKDTEKKENNLEIEEKIKQIEKKYELMAKENQKLHEIVKDKTDDIEDLKYILSVFHKDLNEIKQNKINFNKIINKKPNQSLDQNNKSLNTFNKKSLFQNLKKINLKSKEIFVKKDDSNLSFSAKNSTPELNLKNSTTSTNKTYNKNKNFDEMLETCSISSNCSYNIPKDIYYFQPKCKINSTPPKNIPKLDIKAITQEGTIKSIDSNLNKAFELSLKSDEQSKQGKDFLKLKKDDLILNLDIIPKNDFYKEFIDLNLDIFESIKKDCDPKDSINSKF